MDERFQAVTDNQLVAEAAIPGIGHNRPPLGEELDEELREHRDRHGQLVALAGEAVIIDEISAGKCTDLVAMIAALERELDEERKRRIRPYLEAQRLINDRYNSLIVGLEHARQGENGRGGLRGMLTAWADKKEAEAEAERQRLLEQARQREEEAARARAEAEEKARSSQGGISAELDALHAADQAERLQQRADAIRAEPTRSHLGQVSRRRDFSFRIENLRLLLGWLIKQPGLKNNIEQSARTILGSHFRSIGVDAIERGGVNIPGVTVSIVKGPVNVRR